jgi:hypothetical protein
MAVPPYSPNFAPCDFFLFQKVKLKLKGHRFDTIEEIQAESQRALDTVREKDFLNHSRNGEDGGIGVYMREGTTSRLVAAERPYGDMIFTASAGNILDTPSYIYRYMRVSVCFNNCGCVMFTMVSCIFRNSLAIN